MNVKENNKNAASKFVSKKLCIVFKIAEKSVLRSSKKIKSAETDMRSRVFNNTFFIA